MSVYSHDGDFEHFDTVVVPAHVNGFEQVFMGEKRWPNMKIDRRRIESLKFVAVYQTKPVSGITHYAKIIGFEELNRVGRYDLNFDDEIVEIEKIPYSHSDVCAVQGPRYTTLERLLNANNLTQVFPG